MSTTQGHVTASVVAGPLAVSQQEPSNVGQLTCMGDYLFIHFSPETAQQWIGVLQEIASGKGGE